MSAADLVSKNEGKGADALSPSSNLSIDTPIAYNEPSMCLPVHIMTPTPSNTVFPVLDHFLKDYS